ncbi:MAG TPA: hypothetical protein VN085_04545, partial [Vicinamibacterales bacterium]|nr:hypothetical protein [Vicinamibacterales bacterium]
RQVSQGHSTAEYIIAFLTPVSARRGSALHIFTLKRDDWHHILLEIRATSHAFGFAPTRPPAEVRLAGAPRDHHAP